MLVGGIDRYIRYTTSIYYQSLENRFVFFDCFNNVLIGNEFLVCLALAKHFVGDHFAQSLVIIDELGESQLKFAESNVFVS